MKRRGTTGVALGLVLALAVALDASSCSSSSGTAGLDDSCSLNSDCDKLLICVFGRCHSACAESIDCIDGERCVMSGKTGVCQLPAESTCTSTTPCQSGQVCGADLQCRTPCTSSGPSGGCTTGDYCVPTGATMACYSASNPADEPVLVADGLLSADGGLLADGSAVSSSDGAGPHGGNTPDGALGSSDGGDGGPGGNACPSAQTQFGNVAVGDSNPNFTSGVGVRSTSQLLVFSGYSETPDAGDGGTQNSVYVQAFDPATGASTAAAQPLFSPTGDAATISVVAAASAPSGQIALLYSFYTTGASTSGGILGAPAYVSNTAEAGLYIAFLSPSADAGSGLQVGQTLQVESSEIYGQPHVIWSAASQAFVVSWEYYSTYWFLKVRKFLVDGRAAGGDTDVVPTDDSRGIPTQSDFEQGSVAASGNLFGVAYVNESNYGAMLTLLDAQGNEVGSTYRAGTTGGNAWVTVGGIADGFVYFYDNGTNVTEVTVPTATDAGVLGLSTDGGDAGSFPTFDFPGAVRANAARAIGDDTAGGVGIALVYPDGVSFGYVMADGVTHLGADEVISHTYVAGDRIEISNLAGSFGVSEYSAAEHLTRMAASGCE
jgi:hypothetical protein